MNEEINEEYEFKLKGIHRFPMGGIIVESKMDLEKIETTVKIIVKAELVVDSCKGDR